MQDSHRHQADRQNTTGTRELWALPTIRDLSASKAVMQTAIGDIIAAWKGRANTFRTEIRRIEGVRHEWRFLRLHIDLFWELRRHLWASLCQNFRGIFHGNSKHPFGPLRFAAGSLLCSNIQYQKSAFISINQRLLALTIYDWLLTIALRSRCSLW